MVNPFEETMMAGRGSPHLDPADYTPHEPPGWNEYTDDAFVAPAGSPYFLPQDSSFNMSETFVEPTQQEGIVNWIGNKWDKEKSHLRNEFGIPRGSGPYMPTSREGITNLYNNLEFPKFSRTRNVLDQVGKGLHDTGKLYYDHGMFSDDILDFIGWQPQDNYYNESMNERFNWDQLMDQVSGKRHPYEGALTGAIIGDPHSRFEEYIDNMNMDEGGTEWSPSEEYLGGTTEVAGTTEEKWGQLVRDGVVNPGDSLNPLQIDQLYNQHYEDGVGDMDQFGVT